MSILYSYLSVVDVCWYTYLELFHYNFLLSVCVLLYKTHQDKCIWRFCPFCLDRIIFSSMTHRNFLLITDISSYPPPRVPRTIKKKRWIYTQRTHPSQPLLSRPDKSIYMRRDPYNVKWLFKKFFCLFLQSPLLQQ